MTCPRCGGPTEAGSPRDVGGAVNQTIHCPACGSDVAEVSTRKEAPMARPKDREPDLPGIDREIKPLEVLAAAYAQIRDQRIALTEQEVALKREALALMHKLKKTRYHRDGVDIELVPGQEDVKVKVAKKAARRGDEVQP